MNLIYEISILYSAVNIYLTNFKYCITNSFSVIKIELCLDCTIETLFKQLQYLYLLKTK